MFIATNPTTGEELHRYPLHDNDELERIVAQSAATFSAWRKTGFDERAALLRKVAQFMRDDQERLARLMTAEMGKPIVEARGEVQKAVWCAEHYAEHGAEYLAAVELPSDASHSYVQHLPLGPVLGVLPWNAPFWLAFRFCAPAIMAGNTCLMKHDPHVPACAEAIADAFIQAGAPEGLLQNLRIDNDQVAAVIRHDVENRTHPALVQRAP